MKAISFIFTLFVGIHASAKTCKLDPLFKTLKETEKSCSVGFFSNLVATDKKKNVKIISALGDPTRQTCNTLTYDLPNEVNLNPGESLYLNVPEQYRKRPVTLALLNHRQDPNLPSNKGFKTGVYSTPPGRTSFQVFTEGKSGKGEWRYYRNPSGGVKGSKFAAPAVAPEHETLYDWYKNGHASDDSEDTSTDFLKPAALRMVSVGKNPVLINGVTLQVAPPPSDEYQETIFSPGTKFGEPVTAEGQNFGGGQSHYGRFPEALALGYGLNSEVKLPADWKANGNHLTIPLKPGVKINNFELAVGDTHPNYDKNDPNAKTNEDGGYGTSGWSKISIYLEHADGSRDVIVQNENVPPQGIIGGMPPKCDYAAKPGDKIVVEASNDTSYIMGVRLGTSK